MDVWNDGEEEYYVYFLSWRVYGRNIFFYYRKVCDSWKLIKLKDGQFIDYLIIEEIIIYCYVYIEKVNNVV